MTGTELGKSCDFKNSVFSQPITKQAEYFTGILQEAFEKFVPCKKVIVRPADQSWCNNFTRLLRKVEIISYIKNVNLIIKIF